MLVDLLEKKISVDLRLKGKERLSETGRESRGWLLDSLLSSCNLSSVSRVEVVNGLFRGQFRDGRKDREGITGEEDDVLGVATNGRNLHVRDELKRIRSSGVLSDRDIVEVDFSCMLVKSHILEDCSESDSVKDLWFFFRSKTHAFCIASSFNVEHSLISPNMLVISDQKPISDCAECGLSSS